MNTDNLGIIDQFKGDFSNCVILTFTASLNFFEEMLLGRLINNGCYNNAIIMDGLQYNDMLVAEALSLRYHGRYYNCEAANLKGSHHPKMILLTGEKTGRLLVGSGNLTHSGYSNNLEIFSKFDFSLEDQHNLSIFKEAFHIIKESIARFNLSPAIQKNITLLESSTPWLEGDSEPSQTKLIANLDSPILSQLRDIIPEQNFDEIQLLAPFFDSELDALDSIVQQFPAKQISLTIPGSSTNFPYDLYQQKFSDKVNLYKVDAAKTGNRHCHAKAIYLRSGKKEYLLSGSPNISKAALLATTAWGNLELATLCSAEDGSISTLLSQITSERQVSHKSEIEYLELPIARTQDKPVIRLSSAYLEHNLLHLVHSIPDAVKAEVIVNSKSLGEYALLPGEVLTLPFRQEQEISPVVYLKSAAHSSNKMLITNAFIHIKSPLGYVARKAGSLGKLIGQEFSSLMLGFSPNIKVVGAEDISKQKSNVQMQMEEEGEEKILPEERYFTVAADPAWENSISELGGNVDYHYKNNQIEAVIAHLLSSFRTQQRQNEANASPQTLNHNYNVQLVDDSSAIFHKLNKFVSDFSKKELQQAKQVVLDYKMTEDLVQFIPFLVLSYAGLETPDYHKITITLENFFEAATLLLERLWLEQKLGDYILEGLKPQVASLSFLLPLSLALANFNIWLLLRYPESQHDIYTPLNKYAGIISSIITSAREHGEEIDRIFSPERIQKVDSLFASFADFRPMAQGKIIEMLAEPSSKTSIYKEISAGLDAALEERYDKLQEILETKQADFSKRSGTRSILRRDILNNDEEELIAKLERLRFFIEQVPLPASQA